MRNYTFFAFLLFINSNILSAQNNKPTKEESAAIDSVYQSFSHSYTTFDFDLTTACYLENAVSIAHYDGKIPFILNGNKEILEEFKSFFNTIKSNNQTMTIEFKIIERTKKNDKIFDIGYYKVTYLKDNKIIENEYGKVAIILAKNAQNKWKYATDTNSTATELEFNKAIAVKSN
jgi:ketosteroid isomerase-like protein